jgi:hypothetical protein
VSAVAAAAAALLLIPLREKLQRGVTRVVYGRWHEPYEVLAGLGERLEAAADIDRLLDAAVAELTTGLDLRDVSVRDLDGTVITGTGNADPAAAAAGTVPGADPGSASLPLLAYGTAVGSLTYQAPGRQLSAAEERLLHDLARQLGGALHARLLREDLQRARERPGRRSAVWLASADCRTRTPSAISRVSHKARSCRSSVTIRPSGSSRAGSRAWFRSISASSPRASGSSVARVSWPASRIASPARSIRPA